MQDYKKIKIDKEISYIGPFGKSHGTIEGLRAAKEAYARDFMPYIGPLGKTSATAEGLAADWEEFNRTMKPIRKESIDLLIIKDVSMIPIKKLIY